MQLKTLNIGDINEADKANYRLTLELAVKKSGELFDWALDKIAIKEDWNDRTNFDDIPELAEGIRANEGTEAIQGDALKDGTFVVVDGERRYRSYLYLNEKYPDEPRWKYMQVLILKPKTTLLDRMTLKNTANDGKNFTPLEQARSWRKMLDAGASEAEIARRMGTNRMAVNNRIALSNITPIEIEFVNDKIISFTEWVKLYKKKTDIVERINLLIKAKSNGEALDDVEKNINEEEAAAETNAITENSPPVDPAAGDDDDESNPSGAVNNDEEQQGFDGEATRKMMEELDKDRADQSQARRDEPFAGIGSGPKTGLAALLEKSTVAPSEEPEPELKKTRFTAKELISDEVGSTLGDQVPETGTISETLKEMAIMLKALERHFQGNSKMSDITFKIDKKLRYVQGVVKGSPILANMTGEIAKISNSVF